MPSPPSRDRPCAVVSATSTVRCTSVLDESAQQCQKDLRELQNAARDSDAKKEIRQAPRRRIGGVGDVAQVYIIGRERGDGVGQTRALHQKQTLNELFVIDLEFEFGIPEDFAKLRHVDDVVADLAPRIDDGAPRTKERKDNRQPKAPPEQVFRRTIVFAEQAREGKEHHDDGQPEREVFQALNHRTFDGLLNLRNQLARNQYELRERIQIRLCRGLRVGGSAAKQEEE